MRLLIISPSWLPTLWNGGKTLCPPMALPVLAALTPPDVKIHLVDEHVEAVNLEEPADLVAISFMTAAAPRAYEIADRMRERGIPVVLGGMHPSALPEEAARHADAVIVGEAEGQWETVLRDFAAGSLQPLYRSESRPDLAGLPVPRRDLLHTDRYLVPGLVQTARGCPYACTFCSVSPVFGRRYRYRPVDEVVDEVRGLGMRHVGFIDDNFVASPERAKQLCEAMLPLHLTWVGQGDFTMAQDPELLNLMRRSGCAAMFIGIESISQESLAASHKRPNIGLDCEGAISVIHRAGIDIVGSFVFGLEADTAASCQQTVDFAIRNKLSAAQFAVLTPFPGTPVHDELLAEGRITEMDWAKYTMGNVVYRPRNMTVAELAEARDLAYRRFYSTSSIARRLIVWRRGKPKTALRIALNLSYRRINRGGAIASRLPNSGPRASQPAAP